MSNGLRKIMTTAPCPIKAPLIVTIVGPPCRGKSFAARKISRNLFWKGEQVKVFDVGEAATLKDLNKVTEWFNEGTNVAILDGMHLTKQSRLFIADFCRNSIYHQLFVQIDCEEKCVEENINDTVSFYQNSDNSKDWQKLFAEKIQKFSGQFEKSTVNEGPLIVVNNSENIMQHSVSAYGVQGLWQTLILAVLSSPVIKHRVFYFTRHGESEFNVIGRIGGDSPLSERGEKYEAGITKFFKENEAAQDYPQPRLIWTSELRRTMQTVQNIPGPRSALKDLNEIDAGICEGLTYEEIQERFPMEFAWRDQDKLKYRYPNGESYLDLLQRVDGVVQSLLVNTDLLVVSHQAVLRCILSYFKGTPIGCIPYINVPLHTLIVVKSFGYDFRIETVPLKVECVDTYRIKPHNCSVERTTADALTTVPAHFDTPVNSVIK